LIHVFKGVKYEVEISNSKTGLDLKRLFYINDKLDESANRLRLLYKGHEILDEKQLSIYDFDIHPQVQVSVTEKVNKPKEIKYVKEDEDLLIDAVI
jgi:hypothetical protein